jgi:hypothetical protein
MLAIKKKKQNDPVTAMRTAFSHFIFLFAPRKRRDGSRADE